MTPADLKTDAAPGRSAPVARIDHSALRANVEALLPGSDRSVADLRHDAWGHGAVQVARTLLAAGVDAFIVDRDSPSASADLHAVQLANPGEPAIDAQAVFGLPGGGGTPVMRLTGTILVVKALRAGEGVSYGYSHRADSDTRIALVTGGYAQGIVRGLGNRARVAIAGRTHPMVGRVAMDVCVVDVGDAPVGRGDRVVFFGGEPGDPPLSEWTDHTGMTPAELITAVGMRALREHVA